MNRLKSLFLKFRIVSRFNGGIFGKKNSCPHCYIFLAADYGNLGDVAITYAQRQYLKNIYPNHEVVEVAAGKTLSYLRSIAKNIGKDDIVTVVGGGNMGDMYGDLELLRLMVVDTFKKNKVILFPQTIDYSDSEEGKWLLKKSRKIYSSHPNLIMMAREEISFKRMKELYPSLNVILTPDIVMTLNERKDSTRRENILTLCLRKDKEKADNTVLLQSILNNLNKYNLTIENYDTHIGGTRYSEEEKYGELEKIWAQFRKSRLIITDRLHGMIFAYITGTPAIILPNSNFKIKGCYEWIKDCGNIQFIENENDLNFHFNTNESQTLNLEKVFSSLT